MFVSNLKMSLYSSKLPDVSQLSANMTKMAILYAGTITNSELHSSVHVSNNNIKVVDLKTVILVYKGLVYLNE